MKNPNTFPKAQLQISRSGEMLIVFDQFGNRIPVNINLVKHALGIPFAKKDGTRKTGDMIRADKARAKKAYFAMIMDMER